MRYFELWERARAAPREEAAAIAGEMRALAQRRPEVISELLRAKARGEWQRPEELPRYLYKAYAEEARRRVEEIKQRAVGAMRSVEAFEKEARELRNALENALAQIGARDAADFLIRLASITDAVAEAVKAIERAAPELERSKQWEKVLERAKAGSLTEKDVERLRAAARDLARAWEAYPRLLEFLQRPDIDAKDLYFLYKAAKDLGLREAADFIALIGAARGVFETYGRELYHNPLYEALLPYLGWREWKALLQAPMGVYVVNRLGERLAREAFGRYILFDLYGEAFRDISTLADVPLTVGMPVAFKARDVFFFLPERSYPDKVAKYVAEWTFQGLTEGIRRYYNSREGIQHRAAAHLMAMAGRAVALYKAYDELMNRAKRAEGMERDVLTALAHAVRARAAYEELKMARLHLKYAERLAELSAERAERTREAAQRLYETLTAEASRKFRESIKEIKSILEKYGKEEREEFLKALSAYLGGAAYLAARPDRIHLLIKAAEPMRVVSHVSAELYDALAKAEEAYRIYRRLEKYLAKSVKTPPSPAPDYSIAMFIEGGAKYRRRVVEEAAAELSYHWLRARAGLLLKVDVTSIAYWHREGQIKLPPEAVKALKAMGAYRKAKLLAERGVEPTPLEIVKARLESDVLAIVAASKATPIAKELGEIATALAFHWMLGKLKLPALVVEWIREYRPEDWRRAKEAVEAFKRGDADAAKRLIALNAVEALTKFKAAVSKFVEEAVSIARFSPGAYQRVKEIAEDLSRRGPLEKYLATKIAEALRRVEPLRAPDVEAFKSLPEAVRDGLNRLVRNLEERMLREGYFDAVIKPFSRLFGFGERTDPRELAGRAAAKLRELWRVDLRDGEAYVTGYRQRAEEAYAKALRELEELARAPLAEAAGWAERVFDALAEALSYLVEDRFIAWSEENKDYFNGDELAKTALEIVKEVLGVEARELAAEAIARALGRWAEIGAREYPAWLSQGRLPSTLHLAVVLKTEKYADLLSRRLHVITAAGGGEEGWKIHVFAFHPTLREVVERVRSVVADMLSKGKDAPSHIGIAPVEFVFTVANAWITDEGIATSRLGEEWERAVGGVFDYVIGLRSGYEAIRRYDVYLAVRADPKLKVFAEIYGDEWWKAVEAAAGFKAGEMLIKRLREEYGKRGGRKELLWEWKADFVIAPGLLYALADIVEGDGTKAQYKLAVLREFLKWLASPAQLVPKADPHEWREDNPIFQAAVKIYAAVTGKKLEEVWQEAVERLRAIQPPGVKQELKEEQRAAQRPPAEAAEREKPAEKAEEKQAPSYKEAKAAEKPGEGMRGKAAERPGERAEERGRAAERAEEGAKRPLEKAVERPSERAEGAGQRPLKAEAAGLIPPSKADISAVTWLVGVLGRREMGREEAEALRRAVRKAVERVRAKYGPRLYKTGGEALAELADRAAEEAFTLAATAAESPEAVRYMLLLLENAEGPAFGLAPKSPLEADAARVFAKVAEYVKRAEAEFGAGLLVWNYARAVAEAVLREAERVWEDALRGIATVEQAVKAAVIAAAGVAGALAVHDGLYSTAVVSATAAAVVLAREGAFERAVEYVRRAAEAAYEAAREVFEKAKVALQRLYELFVEAVARALDYVRAHWFILAAAAAGLISWLAAQQLDYALWQDHIALLSLQWSSIIPPLRKIADVLKGKPSEDLDINTKRVLEAYYRLTKGDTDAINTLKAVVEGVNQIRINQISERIRKHAEEWYTQRNPEALINLVIYGTKQYGAVFKDHADAVAYLITTLALLKRLPSALQIVTNVENAWQFLEEIANKLPQGSVTLNKDDINMLVKAVSDITMARKGVSRLAKGYIDELENIRNNLANSNDEFAKKVAEYLVIDLKMAKRLTKSEAVDVSNLTRGERAVGVLLSLTESNWFANAVKRSLTDLGNGLAGTLSIAAAVRNQPDTLRHAFKSATPIPEVSITAKILYWLIRLKLNEVRGLERLIIEKSKETNRNYIKIVTEKTNYEVICFRKKECWSSLSAWKINDDQVIAKYASLEGRAEMARKSIATKIEEIFGQKSQIVINGIYSGSIPTDFYIRTRKYGIDIIMNTSDPAQAAYAGVGIGGSIKLKFVYLTDRGPAGNYRISTSLPAKMRKWIFEEGVEALNYLLTRKPDIDLTRLSISQKVKSKFNVNEFWNRLELNKNNILQIGPYARIFIPLAKSYYVVENLRSIGDEETARLYSLGLILTAVLMDGWVARDAIGLTIGPYEARKKLSGISLEDAVLTWLLFLQTAGYPPKVVYEGKGVYQIVWRKESLNKLLNDLKLYAPLLIEIKKILQEHGLTHGHVYNKVNFLTSSIAKQENTVITPEDKRRRRGESLKVKIGDASLNLVLRKNKVELNYQTYKVEEFEKTKNALIRAGLIPNKDFSYNEKGPKYDIYLRDSGWLKIRIEVERGNIYAKEAYEQLLKYADQLGGKLGAYIREKLGIGVDISTEKKKLPIIIKVDQQTIEIKSIKATIEYEDQNSKKRATLRIIIDTLVNDVPKQYELVYRWVPSKQYKGKLYYQRQGVAHSETLKAIVEALTGQKVPSSGVLAGSFLDKLKEYEEIRKEIEKWESLKPE
ncbi:hypothetical protein [Pyrobaculum sp.]|uniref:hypothetical protein n=1 Tax=Pyrobaculum sp. TaxID=2004705 RepID=UPI003179D83F